MHGRPCGLGQAGLPTATTIAKGFDMQYRLELYDQEDRSTALTIWESATPWGAFAEGQNITLSCPAQSRVLVLQAEIAGVEHLLSGDSTPSVHATVLVLRGVRPA